MCLHAPAVGLLNRGYLIDLRVSFLTKNDKFYGDTPNIAFYFQGGYEKCHFLTRVNYGCVYVVCFTVSCGQYLCCAMNPAEIDDANGKRFIGLWYFVQMYF